MKKSALKKQARPTANQPNDQQCAVRENAAGAAAVTGPTTAPTDSTLYNGERERASDGGLTLFSFTRARAAMTSRCLAGLTLPPPPPLPPRRRRRRRHYVASLELEHAVHAKHLYSEDIFRRRRRRHDRSRPLLTILHGTIGVRALGLSVVQSRC